MAGLRVKRGVWIEPVYSLKERVYILYFYFSKPFCVSQEEEGGQFTWQKNVASGTCREIIKTFYGIDVLIDVYQRHHLFLV